MKQLFLSLLFVGAFGIASSAQANTQQKKTTVNANVNGGKVSATQTTETRQTGSGQANQSSQTSRSKRTTATTNKSGVHMNAGKHKGTYKKSTNRGRRTGQLRRTTKTSTSTSTTTTTQQ